MPASWERALSKYSYPVNLANFADAAKYSDWFECDTGNGDLTETTAFENRFRVWAPNHVEAWYEVVFWKMYSNGAARDKVTTGAVAHSDLVRDNLGLDVTGDVLWRLCANYISDRSQGSFGLFRVMMFNSGLATAATFPAFIDPKEFPMVDRQVARWAKENSVKHDYAPWGGPSLVTYPRLGCSTLQDTKDGDWKFYQSWIDWCRYTRDLLNTRPKSRKRDWTARHVEMAVFTAQRDRLTLNPL